MATNSVAFHVPLLEFDHRHCVVKKLTERWMRSVTGLRTTRSCGELVPKSAPKRIAIVGRRFQRRNDRGESGTTQPASAPSDGDQLPPPGGARRCLWHAAHGTPTERCREEYVRLSGSAGSFAAMAAHSFGVRHHAGNRAARALHAKDGVWRLFALHHAPSSAERGRHDSDHDGVCRGRGLGHRTCRRYGRRSPDGFHRGGGRPRGFGDGQ